MSSRRIDNFIIRQRTGSPTFANSLVLGRGAAVTTTAGGLPELVGARAGETQLLPSGGDDTQALNDALALGNDVRLGPGVFVLSSTLVVGGPGEGGPAPRILGSGITRTRLKMTASGIAVHLYGSYTGIESVTVEGPGDSDPWSTAIHVGAPPPGPIGDPVDGAPTVRGVTIQDVRVENAGFGIRLNTAADCTLRRVTVWQVSETGITSEVAPGFTLPAPEPAGPLVLEDVRVTGALFGIRTSGSRAVVARGITVDGCPEAGLEVQGGTGHQLSGIRAAGCGTGVSLYAVQAASAEGVEIVDCSLGLYIGASQDVSVTACAVARASSALSVSESENVIVGAFRSVTQAPATHVTVTSSPGVFITSLRVVNQGTAPTYDVNVSGAGSRVLFGPNNLTASRVNSGGNYAQL